MMKAYWFFIRWYWPTSILTLVFVVAIDTAAPRNFRPLLFWGFLLLIALPSTIVLVWGARQRAKEFTAPATDEINFSEKNVTGHSNLSRLGSFLMVRKSLFVQVTTDAIFIRPRAPGRGDLYNEFHRIPIKDLTAVEKKGDSLRIAWSGETSGDFTLILADPNAFLASIHRTSLGTPLAY
jgi:hypothetical protein